MNSIGVSLHASQAPRSRGARTRACRVETHLDTFRGRGQSVEPGVGMSRDAAGRSARHGITTEHLCEGPVRPFGLPPPFWPALFGPRKTGLTVSRRETTMKS